MLFKVYILCALVGILKKYLIITLEKFQNSCHWLGECHGYEEDRDGLNRLLADFIFKLKDILLLNS